MSRFAKTLPGELTDEVNPKDFGFDVIREEPLSEEQMTRLVKQLYLQTKERTGMVSPPIERYLEEAAVRARRSDPEAPHGDHVDEAPAP
jgi:hypothetical protein